MVNARARGGTPPGLVALGAGLWAAGRPHRLALGLLALHVLMWGAADQVLTPHPDTIDHWTQSRIWSWGYTEHPPMVAWLLRLFTDVLGSSEGAIEAIALGFNVGLLALIYALAVTTFGRLAAAFTLLGLEATLYFTAGSTIFQIDQPLMLFWLAGLWALLAYQRTGRVGWLLAMGCFAGLGALAKYSMVLFYLGVGIYVTLVASRRREWRNPYQYLGGLLALAIISPMLWWNWRHDWISFHHQLAKAAPGGGFVGRGSLSFTVGYLLIFSAVLIAWGGLRMARRARREGLRDSPATLLGVMALTPIVFFMVVLVRGSFADPKWANLGFLGFYLLLGREAAEAWQGRERRTVARVFLAAYALHAFLLAVVALQIARPFLPLSPFRDPLRQVVGWDETGRQVDALLAERGVPPPRFVISVFYPLASQFALHLASQPLTYSLERPWRNLWSDPAQMTRENTLAVCERNCRSLARRVREHLGFELERLGEVTTVRWGIPRQTIHLLRIAASAQPAASVRPVGEGPPDPTQAIPARARPIAPSGTGPQHPGRHPAAATP